MGSPGDVVVEPSALLREPSSIFNPPPDLSHAPPVPGQILTDMERVLLAFADAPPHPPCARASCVLCARAPGRGERMYAVMKMLSADLRRRPDFTPGRVFVQRKRRA